jgi:hypothetical protein
VCGNLSINCFEAIENRRPMTGNRRQENGFLVWQLVVGGQSSVV